ncbi:MAG: hypothetical protein R8M11_09510 [Gallionella sp.]
MISLSKINPELPHYYAYFSSQWLNITTIPEWTEKIQHFQTEYEEFLITALIPANSLYD